MSRLARRSRRSIEEADTEVDMVPMMNLFLVLILFLLMSASFLNLKAIKTSVPTRAATQAPLDVKDKEIKITAVVEIDETAIKIAGISELLTETELNQLASDIRRDKKEPYPFEKLTSALQQIKTKYPASDTVIVVPAKTVVYDTIIQTMDAARRSNEDALFQNVVISGKVG